MHISLRIIGAWTALLLTATQGEETLCEDRDDRWQVHGSSCKKMSTMCDDSSYGELVQAWCPVTCGRCSQEPKKQSQRPAGTTPDVDAENFTLARSEEVGNPLDNSSKFCSNSSNSTLEVNGTTLAQLGEHRPPVPTVPTNLSDTILRHEAPSVRNLSKSWNTSQRIHNGSGARHLSTGKAILLLEELEESGKDSVDRLLIASPFAFLGKDAFSLNFLKMEANQSSNESEHSEQNENKSTGNRSLIAEILDLLSPANAQDEEEEEKHCPEGWERVIGDVYGGDQFSGGWRHSASSIEDCAWRCLRQPGCGSFEWSPSQKRCFRNSQTKPTHEVDRQDFMFCRRQPCPSFKTKEACVGPGIASGYYSKEVKMRAGSYCIWSAGNCQAPMACTDHDCFLPDGGLPGMELPSSYTLWISRLGLQATMAS